jgi:hypothetical protein
MTNNNEWLDGIKKQLNLLKDTLSERDYKKYKLRLLLCLAERVTQFFDECGKCQIFQKDISALIQDAGNLVQLSDKQRQKSYFKSMDNITNHLEKQHKLVKEGYYLAICIAIGTALGVGLGAAFEQTGGGIPIGVGTGVAIGAAIGAALEAKAKKEGRILYPKETSTTASAMNLKIIAIILGLLVLAGIAAFFFVRKIG